MLMFYLNLKRCAEATLAELLNKLSVFLFAHFSYVKLIFSTVVLVLLAELVYTKLEHLLSDFDVYRHVCVAHKWTHLEEIAVGEISLCHV